MARRPSLFSVRFSENAQQAQKVPRQTAPVEDDDHAADFVDDIQHLLVKARAEQRDDRGDSEKPQHRRRGEAADEKQIRPRGQTRAERTEHHRPVDERLRIEPRHDARCGDELPDGDVHVAPALEAGLAAQQPDADPDGRSGCPRRE